MRLLKTKSLAKVIWFTALVWAVIFCFCGCFNSNDFGESIDKTIVISENEFSVNFLYIEDGDCTIIRFPDNKVLMIDSGSKGNKNLKRIKSVLKDSNVNKIDYYVVTNVRTFGNLPELAKYYGFGKVYLPKINHYEKYKEYVDTLSALEGKVDKLIYATYMTEEVGDGWFFRFLSPYIDGSDNMNVDLEIGNPTDGQIRRSSAVLFLECKGKRFLFLGEANTQALEAIKQNYDVGIYNKFSNYQEVCLENVDLVLLASHGQKESDCKELFSLLKPLYFVVSVNLNNKPDASLLTEVLYENSKAQIYRTDVVGSITVGVSDAVLTLKTPVYNN